MRASHAGAHSRSRFGRVRGVLLALVSALIPILAGAFPASARETAHAATGDVLVASSSDADGYHLYIARSRSGWRWQPLATIQPGGAQDDSWVGQQCITGDGRFVVVVVLPILAVDDPAARDHGALAYSVDVATGQTRPLIAGVSAAYYDPGCGASSTVVLTSYPTPDESTTRLLTVDPGTGSVLRATQLNGEYASAVPLGEAIVATFGNALVRIGEGRSQRLPSFPGSQPFDLHPNSAGGLDLLAIDQSDSVRAWTVGSTGMRLRAVGPVTATRLFQGRGGHNTLLVASQTPSAVSRITGVSLDGAVLLEESRGTGSAADVLVDRATGRVLSGSPPAVTTIAAPTTTALPAMTSSTAVNTSTPTCAVPRNNLNYQVPQPSFAQINWALQQASRNDLAGSFRRPADYLNMGNSAAYQPSVDFPRPQLSGGMAATPVPPELLQGIFAQESNWKQASFHAARGLPGNPLIANYYGSNATFTSIDYNRADCGYGLGQLTSFMTKSSAAVPQDKKNEVAADYAENVAAAAHVLGGFWNQLSSLGITANGGDPTKVEDWYFALWAYNTGIHPKDGAGHYGLGWSNNPINPQYPPNRLEFGSGSGDKSHPNQWPYQELIFGWMDYPYSEGGKLAYPSIHNENPPGTTMVIPGYRSFCSASNNCNPNDPSKTYCQLTTQGSPYYYHCWWHGSATFAACGAGKCHTGVFTVAANAPEPRAANPAPPVCTLDTSQVPASAVIVDEESATRDINVVGCPATPSGWSPGGTFTINGNAPDQQPANSVAAIDLHQLGAGFGGHMWFTHTQVASDTAQTVVGTWLPRLPTSGAQYDIKIFVPDTAATVTTALYEVADGVGHTSQVSVNQNNYSNQWVDVGTFQLFSGAAVSLSNATQTSGQAQTDIAYAAVAFIP